MSGGGGGPIILKSIANIPEVPAADRAKMLEIADRSITGCSRLDALTVIRIVWRLIRQP